MTKNIYHRKYMKPHGRLDTACLKERERDIYIQIISVSHAHIVSLLIAESHPQNMKFQKLLLALDPSLKDSRGM